MEENGFYKKPDTEYLSRLEYSGILIPDVVNGIARVSVKPINLKPNGSIECVIEYLPKHRNVQEEDWSPSWDICKRTIVKCNTNTHSLENKINSIIVIEERQEKIYSNLSLF